jgi:hypothetical protein
MPTPATALTRPLPRPPSPSAWRVSFPFVAGDEDVHVGGFSFCLRSILFLRRADRRFRLK